MLVPHREYDPWINEIALFRGQWQYQRGPRSQPEFTDFVESEERPVFRRLQDEAIRENILVPQVIYGYFPCLAEGNDLAIEEPRDSLQSHVRVGSHVHRCSLIERQRAESIEETPRANQAPSLDGKGAQDPQRAERDCPAVVAVEPRLRGAQGNARFRVVVRAAHIICRLCG